jgi:hypothetical protein
MMSTEGTSTIEVVTPEEELKAKSDKYMQEVRIAMQTRVIRDDGTLSEAGVMPQEQLAKIYRGEPLDAKE